MIKQKFAQTTTTSPEKTMEEIRSTLKRYNASMFGFVEEEARVSVAFEMQGRRVRFVLPLLSKTDDRFRYTNGGPHGRKGEFSQSLYEQTLRSRWRALLLTIKAKLESVESGIETFEEAFMAQLVLPSGETMAEWAIPQIKLAYESGKSLPPLLGGGN